MIAALQACLDWITLHPQWSLVLLFATALLDAIFIIGAFVPAGIVLFAGGALVALGSIELWQAVVAAAAGAVGGDGLSFWLGRRYGERLFANRWLSRYPDLLHNGRRFFARYGAMSVAMARFLGPMRAIVPALGGASGLGTAGFLIADATAAVLWAFAFILPGVAFGASLGLASEVAGRLALLLLSLLVTVACMIWLTAIVSRAVQHRAEDWVGRMLDWSRRHRRLGKFGAALADPEQPETPVLAALAALLLFISALWLWLWAGASLHEHPSAFDAAIFQSMRDLHTPWGLKLAHHLLLLGHWTVYGPMSVTMLASLLFLRRTRAAAHWAAALAFGALLSLGLYLVPTLPSPYAFFGTTPPLGHIGRDLVIATVIYSFLPIFLAPDRKPRLRSLLRAAAVTILTLVLLARLYLGVQWASVSVFSIIVGLIWAALLGLGYRRHSEEMLPGRQLMLPLLAVFVVSLSLAWSAPEPGRAGVAPPREITTAQWQAGAWRDLSHARIDIAGRDKQPLSVQWAGSLDEITRSLLDAGWTAPPSLNPLHALRWLTGTTRVAELPVLPQVHAGRHPALSLYHVSDDSHAELLRLWPTRLQLDDGRRIWLGSISRVEARTVYRLFRYPIGVAPIADPQTALTAMPNLQWNRRGDIWLLSFAQP
ncbi:MAG TPA: VTT domain-containing protein [Fontimonas sp.]